MAENSYGERKEREMVARFHVAVSNKSGATDGELTVWKNKKKEFSQAEGTLM